MKAAAARTRTIAAGTWEGARVRTARKVGRCQYWLGKAGRCPCIIEPGDDYFEGEMSECAGGFARERWCMDHACDGRMRIATNGGEV